MAILSRRRTFYRRLSNGHFIKAKPNGEFIKANPMAVLSRQALTTLVNRSQWPLYQSQMAVLSRLAIFKQGCGEGRS